MAYKVHLQSFRRIDGFLKSPSAGVRNELSHTELAGSAEKKKLICKKDKKQFEELYSVVSVGSRDPERGSEIRRRRGTGVRKRIVSHRARRERREEEMNLLREETDCFSLWPLRALASIGSWREKGTITHQAQLSVVEIRFWTSMGGEKNNRILTGSRLSPHGEGT